MKPSEILRKAKGLIDEPSKWCQGRFDNERGQRCMVGSLFKVCGQTIKENDPSVIYLARATNGLIWAFNDAPERTHSDVMAAFDRAIALAEADERKSEPWSIEDTRNEIAKIVSTADRVSV